MPVPCFGFSEKEKKRKKKEKKKTSRTINELPSCRVTPDPQLKDLTKVFLLLCYQFMELNARLPYSIKNESSSF
jgi:hypothetical protein